MMLTDRELGAVHFEHCPECPHWDGSVCVHNSGGFMKDCPAQVDYERQERNRKRVRARQYNIERYI